MVFAGAKHALIREHDQHSLSPPPAHAHARTVFDQTQPRYPRADEKSTEVYVARSILENAKSDGQDSVAELATTSPSKQQEQLYPRSDVDSSVYDSDKFTPPHEGKLGSALNVRTVSDPLPRAGVGVEVSASELHTHAQPHNNELVTKEQEAHNTTTAAKITRPLKGATEDSSPGFLASPHPHSSSAVTLTFSDSPAFGADTRRLLSPVHDTETRLDGHRSSITADIEPPRTFMSTLLGLSTSLRPKPKEKERAKPKAAEKARSKKGQKVVVL